MRKRAVVPVVLKRDAGLCVCVFFYLSFWFSQWFSTQLIIWYFFVHSVTRHNNGQEQNYPHLMLLPLTVHVVQSGSFLKCMCLHFGCFLLFCFVFSFPIFRVPLVLFTVLVIIYFYPKYLWYFSVSSESKREIERMWQRQWDRAFTELAIACDRPGVGND